MENGNKLESYTSLKRELGLAAVIAIVVGNTIGSGIFMAPQSLASASNPISTIIAWVITAIGSLLLALCYARLGSAFPRTGGSVVYIKEALGEFPSFLSAWSYWISTWVASATIITAFMSYLTYFCPIFSSNRFLAFLFSSLLLWSFTLINIRGVKVVGIVGIITTIFKVLPLIIFVIIAFTVFQGANFNTISSDSVAGMSTVPAAIGITLWAFLGFESATFPAEEIKRPEKNIKWGIIFGYVIIALIYLGISIFAIGAMPQDKLASSNAPLAQIIDYATGGTWGGVLIAAGALISTFGAAVGWILVSGRCSFAAAKDKMFPDVFCKIHPKFRTPYTSLIIAGICSNILLISNYVGTLISAFNFMLLLSTLAALPVYAFTAASEIILLNKKAAVFNPWRFIRSAFLSLLAFAYTVYAIFGTGAEVVMYGFILMLIGVPIHVYLKTKNKHQ